MEFRYHPNINWNKLSKKQQFPNWWGTVEQSNVDPQQDIYSWSFKHCLKFLKRKSGTSKRKETSDFSTAKLQIEVNKQAFKNFKGNISFSMHFLKFKYSCVHFPTTTFPHPPPIFSPTPTFGFVHVSFIHVPWWLFPFFPPWWPSPPQPSGYCQFFISKSLVIFCLLLYFVD